MNDFYEREGMSRAMFNRREADADDDHICPHCGSQLERYLYGDDADGNRGEWRTTCPNECSGQVNEKPDHIHTALCVGLIDFPDCG